MLTLGKLLELVRPIPKETTIIIKTDSGELIPATCVLEFSKSNKLLTIHLEKKAKGVDYA